MQSKIRSKRALALLLLVALLSVSLVVLLPVATSADPEEIQDFNYQTVVGDGVASESTQLRFVFTIGTLDYQRAGFVFSKTNPNPTVDGDDCHPVEATAAYRSITADAVTTPAPNDRWWIAAKLTGIEHISFFTPIYVSAFVDDGTEITYETTSISVLEAFGAVSYDHSAASALNLNRSLKDDVLKGDHFYPTVGYANGKDLYYEMDVLWNPTIHNATALEYNFRLCYGSSCGDNPFTLVTADSDGSGPWCYYAGGFDTCDISRIVTGPAAGNGQPWENYPNLGSASDQPCYGWHRIGVKIHEEAETDGSTVSYTGYAYLYIDGAQVWKVSLRMEVNGRLYNEKNNYRAYLYLMDAEGNYSDPNSAVCFRFWSGNGGNGDAGGTDPFYFIYNNVSWNVVSPDFVPNVHRVATPAASTIKIAGNNCSDAFYFAPND